MIFSKTLNPLNIFEPPKKLWSPLKKFEPLWHVWLKNAIYFFSYIGIGIGSVSADMKKNISVIYRIGRFRKWDLSVLIGIGRFEKKLIGRTLDIGWWWKFKKKIVELVFFCIRLYYVGKTDIRTHWFCKQVSFF